MDNKNTKQGDKWNYDVIIAWEVILLFKSKQYVKNTYYNS